MRPKVSFDSKHIGRRIEICQIVARAHGWGSREIAAFTQEVTRAFSYEEAMEIIDREFDTILVRFGP